MFVRVKRSMSSRRSLSMREIPRPGMLVIVLKGFAAGLIGQVETIRPGQEVNTNKVPVRLCGPGERVWTINWRRLRPATPDECYRWGRETYAEHVARVNGGQDGLETD